jgi:hypothetical protein
LRPQALFVFARWRLFMVSTSLRARAAGPPAIADGPPLRPQALFVFARWSLFTFSTSRLRRDDAAAARQALRVRGE